MRCAAANTRFLDMAIDTSQADQAFRARFEACEIPPADFDHRSHVRLAYIYLAEQSTDSAYQAMRDSLHRFLRHNDVDIARYHDTITRAWILAVRHFIETTPNSESADEFIAANPVLLDSKIMLEHYSADLLFSEKARADFIEPDLSPIPKYDK